MKLTAVVLAGLVAGSAPAAAPAPLLGQWTGVWISGDKQIEIRPTPDGRLAIEGEAYWGGWDPDRVAHGGVHEADFSVEVAPRGARLRFGVSNRSGGAITYGAEEALCNVTVELVRGRLVVDNPDECGAAYVTFTAEYRRRPPHRRT